MKLHRRSGRAGRARAATAAAPAALAVALLGLSGCQQIGNPFAMLGQKLPAPDEFQVIARKPLIMPATDALPAPRPGEPSPLEPDPNRDAIVALLGSDAAPAATGFGPGASRGEQALLSAADVSASNPEIRQTLAAEGDVSARNKPYEPPSIFELFSTAEAPPEDVIDAATESRRLQTEGVAAAPIDPSDRPVVEADATVEEVSPYPGAGIGRRPDNRPLSTVEPAFE